MSPPGVYEKSFLFVEQEKMNTRENNTENMNQNFLIFNFLGLSTQEKHLLRFYNIFFQLPRGEVEAL